MASDGQDLSPWNTIPRDRPAQSWSLSVIQAAQSSGPGGSRRHWLPDL